MDTQPTPNQVIQPGANVNPSGELNAPSAPPTQPSKPPKKSRKKTMLFLVVIAVVLAAGTYLILNKKDKQPVTTSQPETTQQETVQPATVDDIDQASKDLDATLQKADSVKDVGSSDLNDDALGL